MRQLFLLASFLIAPLVSAQELHTFSNGEVADAEKINENLNLLLKKIDALEEQVAVAEPEPEPESQLPFPTGTCSGLIPLDSAQVAEMAGYRGGTANLSLVLDFDDQSAYGAVIYFEDSDRELVAQWSIDQDGSGITLEIVRDELLPASFIASLTVDLMPGTSDERDLEGLQPTGNEFVPRDIVLRLLPTAAGASYIIQGVNITHHGFCTAL